MAQKNRTIRRIDERPRDFVNTLGQVTQGGNTSAVNEIVVNVPITTPEAPENLEIGAQVLIRASYVPRILVRVDWDSPPNITPELYIVEVSDDDNFTTIIQTLSTPDTFTYITLDVDTDYWIRVQAVIGSDYGEFGYTEDYPLVSIHTGGDTTAPSNVNTVVTDWTSDDLEINWITPDSNNFFQTRVRIYDTLGGTLYKEVFVPNAPNTDSRFVFTVEDNNQVTDYDPLVSVYYTLHAQSLYGINATGITGSVSKSIPSTPTNIENTWTNDDGTYDSSVTISWDTNIDAADYRLTIDGAEYITYANFFEYTHHQNIADHRPTLVSGDYNLAYTVQSRNALGLTSLGVSGNATNLAPNITNVSLQVDSGFNSLYAYVNHAKDILDFHHYTWLLYSGSTELQRFTGFTPETSFSVPSGIYTVGLYVSDVFGRSSALLTVSGKYPISTLHGVIIARGIVTGIVDGINTTYLIEYPAIPDTLSVYIKPSGAMWYSVMGFGDYTETVPIDRVVGFTTTIAPSTEDILMVSFQRFD